MERRHRIYCVAVIDASLDRMFSSRVQYCADNWVPRFAGRHAGSRGGGAVPRCVHVPQHTPSFTTGAALGSGPLALDDTLVKVASPRLPGIGGATIGRSPERLFSCLSCPRTPSRPVAWHCIPPRWPLTMAVDDMDGSDIRVIAVFAIGS